MAFEFSATHEMKSQAFPGVVVTLRRIGPVERAEIEIRLAKPRALQREIAATIENLSARLDAALETCPKEPSGKVIEAQVTQEVLDLGARWQTASNQYAVLSRAEIESEFVRSAAVSILDETGAPGIIFDGEALTPEMLCRLGPEALFSEVVQSIFEGSYLTKEGALGFKSLSISAAQGDGEPGPTTTATTVKPSAGTSSADATGSSPSI